MKYVVFWILSYWVSEPCPDAAKVDPYTNKPGWSGIVCDVLHTRLERDTLFKFFDSYAEAQEFVKNGKNRYDVSVIWMDSTLMPAKITFGPNDSLTIDTVKFDLTPWVNDSLLIENSKYRIKRQ